MTGDSADVIINNSDIDVAWAVGTLTAGSAQPFTILHQGSSVFDLSHIPDGEYSGATAYSFAVTLFLALLALAFY